MRKTTPQDAEQILRFLYAYYHENVEHLPVEIDFDLESAWGFLKEILKDESCISYVSDEGVVIGRLHKPWFSNTVFANNLLWYVKPEGRNGLLARSLMRGFDKEASERGAKYCHFALDNPINIKTIDPFVKKLGYRDYSKIYVKDLRDG